MYIPNKTLLNELISQRLGLQLDLGSICQIRKLLQSEGPGKNTDCGNEEKIYMRPLTEEMLTFCPL